MRTEYINGKKMYCFQWDFIDSNMYVILEDNQAFVVDPVLTAEIKGFWSDLELDKVLIVLTHEHFDHMNGLEWLRNHYPCEVIANSVCAENIRSESKNLSDKSEILLFFNKEVRGRKIEVQPFASWADMEFKDIKKIKWQNHDLELISTPGHTDGSICIVFDENYLYTGDTLLDVPTITRLPGGSKKKFEQITLPLLNNMKLQIKKVYPGHGDFGALNQLLSKHGYVVS